MGPAIVVRQDFNFGVRVVIQYVWTFWVEMKALMERLNKFDKVQWKNNVWAVSSLNFYISLDFLVGLQWYPFELLKKGFLLVYTHIRDKVTWKFFLKAVSRSFSLIYSLFVPINKVLTWQSAIFFQFRAKLWKDSNFEKWHFIKLWFFIDRQQKNSIFF